ncbi:hypothetical protein HMPREF0591_1643 [Mycobacterium parascrofulaceum ATCC BAA-614]|uniref:Uncharacterized protein n=1 Tax=Mycobacterium parascrofulaceum ATCC BAA-614 TaxID=525368 RepID=D5P649_9MYCO|nr:hypothetical protein HMPREF0591_1643 [Mycobacterium parascrofulaceum ATCC BAA-614]
MDSDTFIVLFSSVGRLVTKLSGAEDKSTFGDPNTPAQVDIGAFRRAGVASLATGQSAARPLLLVGGEYG